MLYSPGPASWTPGLASGWHLSPCARSSAGDAGGRGPWGQWVLRMPLGSSLCPPATGGCTSVPHFPGVPGWGYVHPSIICSEVHMPRIRFKVSMSWLSLVFLGPALSLPPRLPCRGPGPSVRPWVGGLFRSEHPEAPAGDPPSSLGIMRTCRTRSLQHLFVMVLKPVFGSCLRM